jgi:hypothetical protein
MERLIVLAIESPGVARPSHGYPVRDDDGTR